MGKNRENIKLGRLEFEAQIIEHANDFTRLLELGYSEEQFYNNFPAGALEEIGIVNKTAFIRAFRRALRKHNMIVNKTLI